MEQGAQVQVAGPSRVLLALSTGALVAVTSVATAVVVLSGTAGVAPGQRLDPRPPAVAAPGQPPVVVLPPGAFGSAVPELVSSGRELSGTSAAIAGSPRAAGGSSLVRSLAPQLSAPVPVLAGGLLPPPSQPPPVVLAAPSLSLSSSAEAPVTRPGKRGAALRDAPVLAAPLQQDAATADAPADSLSGTRTLLRTSSDGEQLTVLDAEQDPDDDADKDKAARDRREFVAQERGRRVVHPAPPAAAPAPAPAVTPAVPAAPATPATPATPGVSRAVPAVPASPAAVERRGSGRTGTTGSTRPTGASAKAERPNTAKASSGKKDKQKASGSSSGRRAPQGARGSGRDSRS